MPGDQAHRHKYIQAQDRAPNSFEQHVHDSFYTFCTLVYLRHISIFGDDIGDTLGFAEGSVCSSLTGESYLYLYSYLYLDRPWLISDGYDWTVSHLVDVRDLVPALIPRPENGLETRLAPAASSCNSSHEKPHLATLQMAFGDNRLYLHTQHFLEHLRILWFLFLNWR